MTGKFITSLLVGVLLCGAATAQTNRKKTVRKKTTTTTKTPVVNNPSPPAPPEVTTPQPTPVPTPPPPPSLDKILSEAENQVINYEQAFKDLLATEVKTFERFDKNGNPKDPKTIEADFLVYQSPKDAKLTLELRNVTKVDGKPIPDSQARSQRLLAELAKTSTLQSELEKIQKEGSRYDKTIEVYGYTLFEARILDENIRPSLNFQLLGSENYQGNDVYVIGYQQTRKSQFITLNEEKGENAERIGLDYRLDVPNELKNSDAFVRGKLWVDKKTYQIWRQDEELTIQDENEPLVLLTTNYTYQASDYGILVPKQITLRTNELKKDKDSGRFQPVADTNVMFDYSKFKQVNTDVKVLDDTN